MKHCMRTLLAILLALSLLTAGLAFAEEGLQLDAGTTEAVSALDDTASIDIEGAALVTGEPVANAEANDSDVKINKSNFPAKAFRNYVKKHFDTDGNGALSQAEADAVKEIHLRTYAQWLDGKGKLTCATLKGIEHFPNLEVLEALGCGLTELDVSKNAKLVHLNCTDNKLKTLDVSKNKQLKELICYSDELAKLDVTNNAKLTMLDCGKNPIGTLNVTRNTALVELYCAENQLKKLNVTKNVKLKKLVCRGNQLTALNVKNNVKLEVLDCYENGLKSLDVTKNTRLLVLQCWRNQLNKLDVSKCAKLRELRFQYNCVSKLDISKNTALTNLNCSGNQLKKLDTGKNTRLVQINAWNNKLTSLDVSKNPKLIYLFTYGNSIKKIDLKNCKTLRSYLKNKVFEEDGFIAWSAEGDSDLWGLGIDYATTLTSGSKVLYQGR